MSEAKTRAKANYPSEQAFINAASKIGCSVPMIKAFAHVESGAEGAFLDNGSPVILFERHKFHSLTGGKYDGEKALVSLRWANISSPKPGGYGPTSIQHTKLARAIELDRDSALKSCSWGLFQLMGFNYQLCGFTSLQEFINGMYEGVDCHLKGFVSFILTNPKKVRGKNLRQALIDEDCETAAEIYNGSGYRKNQYDVKLRKALDQFG